MLKLNYTEVGLYMEWIMTSPELLIAQRVLLAMRLGRSLHVEAGYASFLLPANVPELKGLEMALRQECGSTVSLIPVNEEFVEVGLSGSWVAENREAHEGMFLTVMSNRAEFLIHKLWQMSEVRISSLA